MPSRLIIHSLITGLLFIPLVVLLPSSAAAGDESGSAVYAKTRGIFENPGAEYRGKPFWSWNGKLEKDELIRQIHVLKEMGFGGFFMHSRTGLATEYLGEEWFDLINAGADEAGKLGLEAWLYDEDRWPSGSAGGLATENPEFRMKYLRMNPVPADEFQWTDDIIAAFSCRLEGLDYAEGVRIRPDTPKASYQDRTVLFFTVEPMAGHPFYNGNTYLDTMNPEATRKFIELTHERYKAYCGDRLGTTIKGIFTDEPHRGMVMCAGVAHSQNGKTENLTPWTPRLFDAFQEKYGYSLVDHLPELFLRPEGERVRKVKWQYMELLQELFLQNFAQPIHDWCQANNLLLTGHVLHEDSLGAQAVPNGSLTRFYELMDYPGVDVLTEGNRNYWIVKQLSSAAHQLGQKWLLSELYGCTGWQMPFAGHKAAGDWQSLFGINLRCPHLSWYTMEGEAKRDYPASILHQSTWYKEYEPVETYFSRLQGVMTQGKPSREILVINPIESAWAQIHAGWASWLQATTPAVVELDRKYQQLFHWLCGSQLDFDYGDEDFIARKARIDTGGRQPLLWIGQAAYPVVVLSGLETVRGTTLDILDQFIAAGGSVLVAGNPPAYVDAEPSDRAAKLAEKAIRVAFEPEHVVSALEKLVNRPVRVLNPANGKPFGGIFCQAREDGPLRYILALNVNREKEYADVLIQIQGRGVVEEWNCFTGERTRVPARQHDNYLEFTTAFPAMGEHLYVLTPQAGEGVTARPVLAEVKRVNLPGPYAYTLDEPNICVLDRAAYQLDGGPWQEAKEILQVDRTIRPQLGLEQRGGEMLQPWFAGKREHPVKAQLALRFDFEIEDRPGETALLIERPELFQIAVNGHPLSAAEANGWMIDTCLKRIPLAAAMLKSGENFVELQVGFHDGINLEALYLIGDFGVRVEGTRRVLTRLPERLNAGDITNQGLPFYSGKIRYALDLKNADLNGERVFLSVPGFKGACVQVRTPDGKPRMIAWPPYETEITDWGKAGEKIELEVILTRRNTFGPLHQVPLDAPAYGPGNWVTEGAGFTDNYMLYPAGLLQDPEAMERKAGT